MRERKFEKLHFQNFTIRLSNQSDIFAYNRTNFMYVKTYFSNPNPKFTSRYPPDILDSISCIAIIFAFGEVKTTCVFVILSSDSKEQSSDLTRR